MPDGWAVKCSAYASVMVTADAEPDGLLTIVMESPASLVTHNSPEPPGRTAIAVGLFNPPPLVTRVTVGEDVTDPPHAPTVATTTTVAPTAANLSHRLTVFNFVPYCRFRGGVALLLHIVGAISSLAKESSDSFVRSVSF